MKVVAIIQARMGSTRLPGKVLCDLDGKPMLARVVTRARRAAQINEVIVATSTLAADQEITALCAERGWPFFRGDEQDVLDRYYRAALAFHADVVVRITADCPMIDPEALDQVVTALLENEASSDYACNFHPRRTYPRGLDAEALRFDVLERCWQEATAAANREHVTSFIYQHPEAFALRGVESGGDFSHLRWTVDTPEDLELARAIYAYFGRDDFSWRDAVAACEVHPHWADLNQHVVQKAS